MRDKDPMSDREVAGSAAVSASDESSSRLHISMPADAARAIFKYRSRSLDNLKRVYSVILSVSIGKFLENIYQNVKMVTGAISGNEDSVNLAYAHLYVQLALLFILATTVSVFFFQEDKLLDINYGLDPNDDRSMRSKRKGSPDKVPVPTWHAFEFAINYMAVLLTLVPFVYLTFAAEESVVAAVGIKDFFLSYVFLLTLGSSAALINYYMCKKNYGPNSRERRRTRHINMNWLIINGTIAGILQFIYIFFHPNLKYDSNIFDVFCSIADKYFIWLFVILSIVRNFLDYRGTWPMLMLNRAEEDGRLSEEELGEYSKWTLTYRFERWHSISHHFKETYDNENDPGIDADKRREFLRTRRYMAISRYWGWVMLMISIGEFIVIIGNYHFKY